MKKIKLRYILIALAALVLAAAVFLVIYFNRSVTVPNVQGKSITEAAALLNDAGFKHKTTSEYSDSVLPNCVISQEIEGGQKAKYGTEIGLVISKGIEKIQLPSLVGLSAKEAEKQLKEMGFAVSITEEFSNSVEKGVVISQSVPQGTAADKGSTITLTVSKGPDYVTVPNIKGMTLKEAEQAMEAADLRLATDIECSSTVKEGLIISQDIEGNKLAIRNSVINAKISAGPANLVGNTPSNANNFGIMAAQGDWIYFAGSKNSVYRMRRDSTELQCISTLPAVSLNVLGEWVYFAEGNVGGIYKVKLDGSGLTKISSATSYKVYAEGEWVYYTSDYWGGILYKMKTDGSSVTQITKDSCKEFIVYGGYVYYVNSSDYAVYKCSTSGGSKELVCEGFSGGQLSLVGDRLVITELYTVKSVTLSGGDFTSFGTTNVQYALLNGYGEWLYYLQHDFRDRDNARTVFGRMKYDGSEQATIHEYVQSSYANQFINIDGEWLYFKNSQDNGAFYRVKLDGTKLEKLG